jgi:Zn-dependent protease
MDLLRWLLPLALLLPILWLLRVILVARALASLRIGRDRVERIDPAILPPHLQEAFLPRVRELEALGFVMRQTWSIISTSDAAFNTYCCELAHATEPIRAAIRPGTSAENIGHCSISLRTLLSDGRELITRNRAEEEVMPMPDRVEVETQTEALPDALVARHRGRVAAAGVPGVGLSQDESFTREQEALNQIVDKFSRLPHVVAEPDGRLRWSFWAACRKANELLRAEAARKKALKRKNPNTTPPVILTPESQTEFEWSHYRQLAALQSGKMARLPKTLLTLVSFALFAVVIGWQMSPLSAVVLIVALIVHEGGHLLGMWWFGHRDLQLLFLPFFGGAAVGMDDKVLKPWQHLVIIFLGPLPGIFLGLGLWMMAGDSEAMQTAAMIVVILNAFNLLPILPLDGGQIVDTAFTARFAALRTLFVAGSGVALILITWAIDGGTLLFVLGGFMLLRVPVEWRTARILRELRRELAADATEEAAVRAILPKLRTPAWKAATTGQRIMLARTLQNTARRQRPGWGTMAFAAVGYTSVLWLGLPLALVIGNMRGRSAVEAAEARAATAGVALVAPSPVTLLAVSDEENAAVPFYEAIAGMGAIANVFAETGQPTPVKSRRGEEVVALLRAAGRRPVAVWDPKAPQTRNAWARSLAFSRLSEACEEQMRQRMPGEALAIAIDGLKLERHLWRSPEWGWSEHLLAQKQLWTAVEEALSGGAPLTHEAAEEINTASDERAEIEFVRHGIMADQLARLRILREGYEMPEGAEGLGSSLRFFRLLELLNPSRNRQHAEQIDQVVQLRDQLSKVGTPGWTLPELKADPAAVNGFALYQAADHLAFLRLARVGAAVCREVKEGKFPNDLGEIRGEELRKFLAHPVSGRAMEWRKLGAAEVLVFPAIAVMEEMEPEAREIQWRLPERKP